MLMLATTAAMSEQFNKNNILILEEMGYEVHVAGNWKEGNPISNERLEEFKEWIAEHHGKWFHIPSTRKPNDLKNNFVAYKEVVRLIREHKYEFIHCHTPIGSVIGRIAAHFTKTKIIYTAHGFHFYKGAPIKNWLLYYPVEWFLSYWTDLLILINEEDLKRAKKLFHSKKISYIPGIGIDLNKYKYSKELRAKKREELKLDSETKMFLSVGELIPRKNFAIVIESIKLLGRKDVQYFICGQGTDKGKLVKLIYDLKLDKQVHILGFRTDILELCNACDCFVFPSLQEGISVALMEAIACEAPVICSRIRGNVDMINNDNYLFDPLDIRSILLRLQYIISNQHEVQVKENYAVLKKYDVLSINLVMRKIYKEIVGKE